MSGNVLQYPSAKNLANNTWLSYNQPRSGKIYLFTMPTSSFQKFGVKKPLDMVAHWAICINGMCYELVKRRDKRNPYQYQPTPEPEFVQRRHAQEKTIEYGELGYMAAAYSHELIDQVGKSNLSYLKTEWSTYASANVFGDVATLVWERSLAKKYAYDKNNYQVFIRLLLELIGDRNINVGFSHYLDKWARGIGNTRDGGAFFFAGSVAVFVAGLALCGTDGGATSASAGLAIALQLTLRSSMNLLNHRHDQAMQIKAGQKEIREAMRKLGTPIAEA